MSFQINLKKKSLIYFLLPLFILSHQLVFANNSQVYIEHIDLNKQNLIIKFSGKTAFQTVQVDDYQILIALKGILSDPALNEPIKKSKLIKKISLDKMASGVTALVVYTNKEVRSYSTRWLENENSLFVSFVKI